MDRADALRLLDHRHILTHTDCDGVVRPELTVRDREAIGVAIEALRAALRSPQEDRPTAWVQVFERDEQGEWVPCQFVRSPQEEAGGERRADAVLFLLIRDGLLLMERCAGKAEHHPGEWFIPGGRVEAGETIQEALMREVREELGVEVVEAVSLPWVDASGRGHPRGSVLMAPFVVDWRGELPDHCLDHPETPLSWVSLDEAARSPAPVIRSAVALARSPGGTEPVAWRPIETAPMYADVLVWVEWTLSDATRDGAAFIAARLPSGWLPSDYGAGFTNPPRYWMPLPVAPAGAESSPEATDQGDDHE